jgi:hypothetical protein
MIRKMMWLFPMSAVLLVAVSPVSAKSAKSAKEDPVKRGEYLVMVGGCNDCHTPFKMTPIGPMPDMERMLSGHPEGQPDPSGTLGKIDLVTPVPDLVRSGGGWRFPFGINYSRNLTPDKTGLGEWTEAQFIKTLRTGRHQGEGRALLPPMPWFNYGGMPDDDLKAVWAYLRSIPPIKNTVPDPKVPPQVLDQFLKNNAAIVDMVFNHKEPPPAPQAAALAPAAAPGPDKK